MAEKFSLNPVGAVASAAQTTEKKAAKSHTVELDNHKLLAITGVTAVPVFTDKGITVELEGETLNVGGHDLQVKNLDVENGRLNVEGYVTSLRYTGSATPKSFLKKLLK